MGWQSKEQKEAAIQVDNKGIIHVLVCELFIKGTSCLSIILLDFFSINGSSMMNLISLYQFEEVD